jgi:hypothetical protein
MSTEITVINMIDKGVRNVKMEDIIFRLFLLMIREKESLCVLIANKLWQSWRFLIKKQRKLVIKSLLTGALCRFSLARRRDLIETTVRIIFVDFSISSSFITFWESKIWLFILTFEKFRLKTQFICVRRLSNEKNPTFASLFTQSTSGRRSFNNSSFPHPKRYPLDLRNPLVRHLINAARSCADFMMRFALSWRWFELMNIALYESSHYHLTMLKFCC